MDHEVDGPRSTEPEDGSDAPVRELALADPDRRPRRRVVRLSEPWVDGDDVYWLEGRPAEAGRSVLVRRDRRRRRRRPDARRRSTSGRGSTSTAAGPTSWRAGPSLFSHLGDGRLYRLDPGDDDPQPITPEGPYRYADLRFDPGAAAVPGGPRGPQRRGRATAPRSWTSRWTATGPPGPRTRAPTSSPRRGRRPTADGSPGSNGITRTCRGTPPGCASRRSLDDGALGPIRPRRRRARRVDRPARVVARRACSTSSATGPGWWNLYRLVDGSAGSSPSRRWRPSSPIRPGCSTGRPTGSCRTARSSRSAARAAATGLFHIAPGTARRRGRLAVHGDRDAPRRPRRGRRATSAPRPIPRRSCRSTRRPSRRPGCCAARPRSASTRDHISVAESITFPTAGGRMAHALFYRPANPDVVGARGRAAAAPRARARRARRPLRQRARARRSSS